VSSEEAQPDPVSRVLKLFELERAEDGSFLADSGPRSPRLFGGQVAAQATIAAGRSVDLCSDQHLHSLHAYFLRPGRGGPPIRYAVEPLKDGRNFAARSVTAMQGEEVIFTLQASFVRPENGIAHQESEMPAAAPPEDLGEGEPFAQLMRERFARLAPELRRFMQGPVEMREAPRRTPGEGERARRSLRRVWIRPRQPLPEDPLLHAAMIVWVSDRSLIQTGVRPHGFARVVSSASLDHSLWFHRAPRFDDWLLYTMESPVAHSARALIHGNMYRRDGAHLVSVAQEGLIRVAQRSDAPRS
jgi:acyl-CoA thioesterase-2